MKTVTRDFYYRGEHFTIVYDGKYYMTVNHKLIGDDGHPIRTLTWADGLCPGATIQDTIEQCRNRLDVAYYMSQGMSRADAIAKALNLDPVIMQIIQ